QRLSAEEKKQEGCHDDVERGGAQQAAEDGHGDGMEYFPPRFVRTEQQRRQCQACAERRHEDGTEPFQTAPHNQTAAELLSLMEREIDVVGYLQNPVTCGN